MKGRRDKDARLRRRPLQLHGTLRPAVQLVVWWESDEGKSACATGGASANFMNYGSVELGTCQAILLLHTHSNGEIGAKPNRVI